MLMSVAEVSALTNLSKVSIYNKIKLKEIQPFIVKNKGITYICEEGINLIKEGLNLKDDSLNYVNDTLKVDNDIENREFEVELKVLNKEYLNSLKSENEVLKKQLDEKDKQISELHKLIENSQVLLKEEQKKSEQHLYLVEHFEEVDNKLQDLREKMDKKGMRKKVCLKFF